MKTKTKVRAGDAVCDTCRKYNMPIAMCPQCVKK